MHCLSKANVADCRLVRMDERKYDCCTYSIMPLHSHEGKGRDGLAGTVTLSHCHTVRRFMYECCTASCISRPGKGGMAIAVAWQQMSRKLQVQQAAVPHLAMADSRRCRRRSIKETCCTRSVQRALLATTLSPAAMMRVASWMHVGSMAPTWAAAQHQGVRLAAACTSRYWEAGDT
jgi:hypothetical protein